MKLKISGKKKIEGEIYNYEQIVNIEQGTFVQIAEGPSYTDHLLGDVLMRLDSTYNTDNHFVLIKDNTGSNEYIGEEFNESDLGKCKFRIVQLKIDII